MACISPTLTHLPFGILTPSTGRSGDIAPSSPFHNGSISRICLPLRYYLFHRTHSTSLLEGIVLPFHLHNGRKKRNSLPLRYS